MVTVLFTVGNGAHNGTIDVSLVGTVRVCRAALPHLQSSTSPRKGIVNFTSQAANNGSAFAGLTGNTPFYNLAGAVAMFIGRFWMIVPAMAIAGSLAAKKTVTASSGTFPTTGGLFVGLLVGVILIVGGLTFFPALALGPIAEHLAMLAGGSF